MRGVHESVAKRDRAAVHRADADEIESPDRSDDIQNRINGSNLVQMHFLDGRAVDFGFDRRDRFERCVRFPFHVRRRG